MTNKTFRVIAVIIALAIVAAYIIWSNRKIHRQDESFIENHSEIKQDTNDYNQVDTTEPLQDYPYPDTALVKDTAK